MNHQKKLKYFRIFKISDLIRSQINLYGGVEVDNLKF